MRRRACSQSFSKKEGPLTSEQIQIVNVATEGMTAEQKQRLQRQQEKVQLR